jgi:hypothetical protein
VEDHEVAWAAFDGSKLLDRIAGRMDLNENGLKLREAIKPKIGTIRANHTAFVTPLIPEMAELHQVDLKKGTLESIPVIEPLYNLALSNVDVYGEASFDIGELLHFVMVVAETVHQQSNPIITALQALPGELLPTKAVKLRKQLEDNIITFIRHFQSFDGQAELKTLRSAVEDWRKSQSGNGARDARLLRKVIEKLGAIVARAVF